MLTAPFIIWAFMGMFMGVCMALRTVIGLAIEQHETNKKLNSSIQHEGFIL